METTDKKKLEILLHKGDEIIIKKEPQCWASLLSDNCPINTVNSKKIKYPCKGTVMDSQIDGAGGDLECEYVGLAIKIGRKIYGFAQDDLDYEKIEKPSPKSTKK